MPSEREYEQVLQKEPANGDAFVALRKAYRESGRFDRLVTLYETRAQASTTKPKRLSYSTCGRGPLDHLRRHLGEPRPTCACCQPRCQPSQGSQASERCLPRTGRRTDEYLPRWRWSGGGWPRAKDSARIES